MNEHEAFYATAAQVAPVLLLALILESRLTPPVWATWLRGFSLVTQMVGVAVALGIEALALTALAQDKDAALLREVIFWGLGLLLVSIIATAFTYLHMQREEKEE